MACLIFVKWSQISLIHRAICFSWRGRDLARGQLRVDQWGWTQGGCMMSPGKISRLTRWPQLWLGLQGSSECTFVHFYIYEASRSHLCSLGEGRGALVRDFPHRGDLVCDRRGTHSSPELATLDHSRIRRSCCAADSTFHPVCVLCWEGGVCVGQAEEEMGVGRLASGRAVDRTEDTGHNYGSGGKECQSRYCHRNFSFNRLY